MKNASFIVHNPSIYWGQTAWCVNSDAKSQGSDLQNCPSVQDTPKINHHMLADQELVRVFLTENCNTNAAILDEFWFWHVKIAIYMCFYLGKMRTSSWSASMWWFIFGVSKSQAWRSGSFWSAGDLKHAKTFDFLAKNVRIILPRAGGSVSAPSHLWIQKCPKIQINEEFQRFVFVCTCSIYRWESAQTAPDWDRELR